MGVADRVLFAFTVGADVETGTTGERAVGVTSTTGGKEELDEAPAEIH
jgi:hypothetical protein